MICNIQQAREAKHRMKKYKNIGGMGNKLSYHSLWY